MRRAILATVASASVMLGGVFGIGSAQASQVNGPQPTVNQPDGCPTTTEYSVYNSLSSFVRDASKTVYGQPGVTLSISAASGTTFSGTVGGSGSFSIDAIVADAKIGVDSSITKSKTTTVTLGGSWTVPSNQSLGWLALGSQGYKMNWSMGHYSGTCVWSQTGSGTALLPALAPVIGHS